MNVKSLWLALFFGFSTLTLLFTGRAVAAGDTAVAVLGVEASEGAPDSVAGALTDALRQRVSSTRGFRLVPGRDLMEVKLVFSCPDEAPSCMAQAAKSLGAQKLLFGTVKKAGIDGYLVTLKLLDSGRSAVDAWVSEQITRAQATGPAIRGPVQKWFATLTGQGTTGTIRVASDVPGASILLDGVPVGAVSSEPIALTSVPTGRHEVTVSKAGYDPVRREVDVRAGETESVQANLNANAAPAASNDPGSGGLVSPDATSNEPAADETGSSGSGLRTAGWVVTGAGVAALALGIKFSFDVRSINKNLDPLRRFACKSDPDLIECDASGAIMERPLLKEDITYRDLRLSDGHRFQTYQWIAYGSAAALLGVGGYLLYRGYSADEATSTASRGTTTARLLPQVGPGQAGFVAAFAF